MARGVSSGGGQSSLGYLFGPEAVHHICPAAAPPLPPPPPPPCPSKDALKCATFLDPDASTRSLLGLTNNNYHRADGQNSGNFITDRPSTKVHRVPGGGSSLGYLFGDDKE